MTIAVCLNCGAMKFGAYTTCQSCGYLPESAEDKAKHLMLTDHYHTRQKLEQFSASISQTGQFDIDEQTMRDFISNAIKATQIIESRPLVEEYLQTMSKSHLKFFNNQSEYSQTVEACLWLFRRYSSRVANAHESGGWTAAEAEFNNLLDEDPRLKPLKVVRLKNQETDCWMVIYPA